MVIVQTGLIDGTFVSEEEIEKATEENPQDDEEAGLRNLGGNDMSSMKAKFRQARKYYEAHHCKIVLHLLPSPANQTGKEIVFEKLQDIFLLDLEMFVIIMVTLISFSFREIHSEGHFGLI